jgi:hypothetical protein
MILHALRREGGGDRRLGTWVELLSEIGVSSSAVTVLPDNRWRAEMSARALSEVVTGRAAIESIVWNRSRVLELVASKAPMAVVCITARAISPVVLRGLEDRGVKRIVVDLVDPLSKSYSQRAGIVGGTTGMGYRMLASSARRSERSLSNLSASVVAAGWGDARQLGVTWLPILLAGKDSPPVAVDPAAESTGPVGAHAVFVGTLDYAPNIDAVERLCRSIWPRVTESVPGAVLSIAGRRPSPRVVGASRGVRGVQLLGQFEEPLEAYRGALVSVSPLSVSTGFQIKVLDAAEMGVAQVLTPAAIRGFAPGFPARVASEDEALASAVVDLLRNVDAARELGVASRQHAHDRYSTRAWKDEVSRLIC